jgi:hypothetical protein
MPARQVWVKTITERELDMKKLNALYLFAAVLVASCGGDSSTSPSRTVAPDPVAQVCDVQVSDVSGTTQGTVSYRARFTNPASFGCKFSFKATILNSAEFEITSTAGFDTLNAGQSKVLTGTFPLGNLLDLSDATFIDVAIATQSPL